MSLLAKVVYPAEHMRTHQALILTAPRFSSARLVSLTWTPGSGRSLQGIKQTYLTLHPAHDRQAGEASASGVPVTHQTNFSTAKQPTSCAGSDFGYHLP
jgi:hypothetical protein